jgi:hypothetical protein
VMTCGANRRAYRGSLAPWGLWKTAKTYTLTYTVSHLLQYKVFIINVQLADARDVMPDVYAADPMVVLHERFICVQGLVQNQDGVVHLKAQKIIPLSVSAADVASHDFH